MNTLLHKRYLLCGIQCTLQKQIGCFNYRVVTMAADKLKREWLCIVY